MISESIQPWDLLYVEVWNRISFQSSSPTYVTAPPVYPWVSTMEQMCALHPFSQRRKVPFKYVCASISVTSSCWCGKNNYIKRLSTNLSLASIFYVASPESHESSMHCKILPWTSLYLWMSDCGIYSARQTRDILISPMLSLEEPSCLSPIQLQQVMATSLHIYTFI